jgi:TMEM175 potassium channel family protein
MQVTAAGRKTFNSDRLIAFSDGVMAVAATLLVLDLKLPEGVTDSQLGGVLSGSLHNLWVYVLSFVVVGLLWMGHHEQFSHIKRVDGLLIWLNLFYLMTIGLIPFLTSLLADHASALPTCLYASVLVTTSLVATAMWWHASRDPDLMSKDVTERTRREGLLAPLLTGAVFALSILIAVIWGASPAQWSWLLLIPVARVPTALEMRRQNN